MKRWKRGKINKDKPFVIEWRGDQAKTNGLFLGDWSILSRHKTRELAINAIAGQLFKSNLFLFRLRGEDTVYCRGY